MTSLLLFLQVLIVGEAGMRQPAATPEVFGAGVLSTGEVFRGTFSRDGATFYFFKKVVPDSEEYRIFVSTREGTECRSKAFELPSAASSSHCSGVETGAPASPRTL